MNGIVVLMVCIDSVLKGQCCAVFFPVWSSNFCWRILRQVLFCFFVFVIFTLAWIRFWKIYLKLTNSSISHKTSFEHNQCVLFLLIIFQNNVNWWLMVVFFFLHSFETQKPVSSSYQLRFWSSFSCFFCTEPVCHILYITLD